MSTETLLTNALEDFKERLLSADDVQQGIKKTERWEDYYHGRERLPNATFARLRLDWEFAVTEEDSIVHPDTDPKTVEPHIATLMLEQCYYDLLELITDGDWDHYSDPLLKAMSGEKKRGMKAKHIEIVAGHLYREYKESKSSLEMTLYTILYVEFE